MEVAAEHIAQPVADYNVVIAPSYTVVLKLFVAVAQNVAVLQTVAEVAQGRTVMEVMVCGCAGMNCNGGDGVYDTCTSGSTTCGNSCAIRGSSLFTKYESCVLSWSKS